MVVGPQGGWGGGVGCWNIVSISISFFSGKGLDWERRSSRREIATISWMAESMLKQKSHKSQKQSCKQSWNQSSTQSHNQWWNQRHNNSCNQTCTRVITRVVTRGFRWNIYLNYLEEIFLKLWILWKRFLII